MPNKADKARDDIFGQIMVYLNNSGLFGTGGTHSYDCGRLGILNVYMGRTGWDRTWMPIAGALPRDVAKKLSTETLEAMGAKLTDAALGRRWEVNDEH